MAENLRLRNKGESSEFESDQKRSPRMAATCAEHKHASHQTSEYLRQLPSESSPAEREFEAASLKRMDPRSLRSSHKHNDNDHIIPTTLRMSKHAPSTTAYMRIREEEKSRNQSTWPDCADTSLRWATDGHNFPIAVACPFPHARGHGSRHGQHATDTNGKKKLFSTRRSAVVPRPFARLGTIRDLARGRRVVDYETGGFGLRGRRRTPGPAKYRYPPADGGTVVYVLSTVRGERDSVWAQPGPGGGRVE